MSKRELNRIEQVFHAVLELPVDQREAHLKQACNGDKSLYDEVSSLISALDHSEDFIEQPALDIGFHVLAKANQISMMGKTIGAYKISAHLGKGGMGEVYLAEDLRLGRKVALKFLSEQFVGDNWAKRQLQKEAAAVAKLDHPNICAVYGIEEFEEHTFIVMQYVEGQTLAELINQRTLEPDAILTYATQIISAVEEAHAHGIIHRDIKPRNIMVTSRGQIKVLDFGLAKTVQTPRDTISIDSVSQMSDLGVLQGTVAYMSPEQLRGERLDFRSDVFSLGTVLFELVNGQNPFAKGNPAETISAILTLSPTASETSFKKLRDLCLIINKCLEKDKEKRYHSASELLLDINNQQASRTPWSSLIINARLVAVLATLIVLSAVAVFIYRSWTRSYSLAILPFTNQTDDRSLDFFEEEFPENLIARVSKLPRMKVNAFTSVLPYKRSEHNYKQLAENLGVDAVLVGRIERQGDVKILQTDLISASDGKQIWGNRYDLTTLAVSDLQENLTSQISSGLMVGLGFEETKSLAPGETTNNAALLEYLRGKHFWNRRSRENIAKAIERFKGAIDLEPTFALAHAALADCYALLNSPAYGNLTTEEAMGLAKTEINQALTIDPNLPEAKTSLGIINLKYDWNWREAENHFRQALRLKPDSAVTHYWLANVLTVTGRQKDGLEESQIAKRLDPTSPSVSSNVCRQYYYLRDYNAAETCHNALLELEPNDRNIKYTLGFVALKKGEYDKAIEIFRSLPDDNRELKLSALGYALAQAGRAKEAQAVLEEVESLQKKKLLPSMEMVVVYIGMGKKDEAFAWLEKAYAERASALIYLAAEPGFDSLRSDPRFTSLAKRMNLPVNPMVAQAESR